MLKSLGEKKKNDRMKEERTVTIKDLRGTKKMSARNLNDTQGSKVKNQFKRMSLSQPPHSLANLTNAHININFNFEF